ncbi:TspO/MBR family protein [soil metagenome]
MKNIRIKPFIISLFVCFSAGAIGSIFTASSIPTWYATLNKPFFNPPNWIFGPVWTTLYFLMAVSLYKVWINKTNTNNKNIALICFGSQLLLNTLWSIIFFGFKSPFLAFITIIILWILILQMIISFYRIDKNAGLLQIPYLLWVSFAALLNFFIMILNR